MIKRLSKGNDLIRLSDGYRAKLAIMAVSMLGLGYSPSLPAQMMAGHGEPIYHSFIVKTAIGASENGGVLIWDFDGWVGNDDHKLILIHQGEQENGMTSNLESQIHYSYNLAEFWDVRLGLRQDSQPNPETYAVFGFAGLAPYWLETDAYLFLREEGRLSAKLGSETELRLSQQLVLNPYGEISASTVANPKRDEAAGITDSQIGLRLIYEINQTLAPFVDFNYQRKWGNTADLASENGEDRGFATALLGWRVSF